VRCSTRLQFCRLVVAAAVPAFVPICGLAQDAPGELDTLIETMQRISQDMSSGIAGVAITLLYSLAALELAWTFAKGTMKGEGFAILLTRLIIRLVIVGSFALCLGYGGELVRLVIDSAVAVANVGGSATEPSPSAQLSRSLAMIGRLLGEVSILSPGHSIGLVIVAMVVAITAAAMAAIIVVVYAELYLVAVAGLFGLGFGGLEATRDIAVTYLRMLIGKGFKLLTLLIVNGLVMATLETAFQADGDLFSAMQILIIQIVGLILVMRLPSAVESMVSGAGSTSAAMIAGGFAASTGMRAMTATGRTAGSAAYGGVKGGADAFRAENFKTLTGTALGTAPPSGFARAAANAGPVMKGAAIGAATGAVSGLSGEGPHRKATKDVLSWLEKSAPRPPDSD